jgi:predicted RNA-binding Zn-ribbon protein involved in translation (DUF1610 family)
VKPHLVRRLYENDAQGLCDEELLNEVGWALYSRCKSFILAMEASHGRVHCPGCDEIVTHTHKAKEVLRCPKCGWECLLKDYLKTIKNQQLNGGSEVVGLFQDYVDRFPKASLPTEKMLLVDMLIHGFHHFIRSGRTRRPVGVNLIDGNLEFVIDFLDRLAYGSASTPGLQQTQSAWREKIKSLRNSKRVKAVRP